MLRFAINQFIKSPEVRVILENGENLGVMTRDEAIKRAQSAGRDLVLVVEEAKPPVCKILDYKKFLYVEKQRLRKAATSGRGRGGELKELRFGPRTGGGDIDFRIRRTREWLSENNKVKFTLQLRGRELAHPEVGLKKFDQITRELADIGEADGGVSKMGNSYSLTFKPKK
jgi:translation initiation factor IF-3